MPPPPPLLSPPLLPPAHHLILPPPSPSDACREDYYLADSVDGFYDKTYVDKCQADDTGGGNACCSCPQGADCAEGSNIETIAVLP